MTLNLPYPIGPYRLEKALGRGGMGMVYEAYDERLERSVAIKRLLNESDDPRRRERLRREARHTAQLAHPAIVQVFDLVEDHDGSDWIVMERVAGAPLSNLLRLGPLEVDEALHYGRQIAEGLAAAHDQGIVHRDLKTENVMVLPDGRVKILDFGIAKQLGFSSTSPSQDDLSRTGEILGTSRAMAPEQAQGVGVGPRSDLFSLGVLLYESLSGKSPFRAATPLLTLTRVVSHQPQPIGELVQDLPDELGDLIGRLLSKAPELRPADATEVATLLGHLIDERRSGTHQPPTREADQRATVFATGELTPTPGAASIPSSESAFRVVSFPWRAAALFALLVVALLGAATLLDAPASEDTLQDLAAGTSKDADPVRLYEETLRSLRRLERPEDVDRSITVFRGLIESDPSSAAAYAGLARAYWEKSRNASAGGDPVFLSQALAMAEEAVELNGYLADARATLGLVLYAKGRHGEAGEELRTALELQPTHPDAHYGLGKLAEVQGRPDEAMVHYRSAVEHDPLPIYSNTLGALLYDRGLYDEAEAAFAQSLEADADNLHALRNLGAIYFAQGRQEEAASMLQSALKVRPDASLFSNLGTIFFSRGLYSKAAAAFEDALAIEGASNRYIFWLNLADAYRQLPERSDDAATSYRRAILMLDNLVAASPADVRLRSRRAIAWLRLGDRSSAMADLEFLRRSEIGGDLYSRLRLAIAEELAGERELALAALGEALAAGLSLSEVRFEPDLTELRADPRFHQLLVGLEGTP